MELDFYLLIYFVNSLCKLDVSWLFPPWSARSSCAGDDSAAPRSFAFTPGATEHGALVLSCLRRRRVVGTQDLPLVPMICVSANDSRAGAPEKEPRWRTLNLEAISQE